MLRYNYNKLPKTCVMEIPTGESEHHAHGEEEEGEASKVTSGWKNFGHLFPSNSFHFTMVFYWKKVFQKQVFFLSRFIYHMYMMYMWMFM